jgi:hypothetical protein
VAILRAVYARWARGDFWTPEVVDPEVEVVWARDMRTMRKGRATRLVGYVSRTVALEAVGLAE